MWSKMVREWLFNVVGLEASILCAQQSRFSVGLTRVLLPATSLDEY